MLSKTISAAGNSKETFKIQAPTQSLGLHLSGVDLVTSTLKVETVGVNQLGFDTIIPEMPISKCLELFTQGFGLVYTEQHNTNKSIAVWGEIDIAMGGNYNFSNSEYLRVTLDLKEKFAGEGVDANIYAGQSISEDGRLLRVKTHYVGAGELTAYLNVAQDEVIALPKAYAKGLTLTYSSGVTRKLEGEELFIHTLRENEVQSVTNDLEAAKVSFVSGSSELYVIPLVGVTKVECEMEGTATAIYTVDKA